MRQSEITVYFKIPKKDADRMELKLGDRELARYYAEVEGMPERKIESIFASAVRQNKSEAHLKRILPRAHYVKWHPLVNTRKYIREWKAGLEHATNAKFLLTHGGDNTFQFATPYRLDNFILGLNSDPSDRKGGSHGHLLWGTVAEFEPYLKRIYNDDFGTSPWMRLELTLNGVYAARASNQISLCAKNPNLMSRHELRTPSGLVVEQTGSGLLVATGPGSTGWYRSERGNTRYDFRPNAQEARWFVRGAQRFDDNSTAPQRSGRFRGDQKLVIQSLNARGGVAAVDDYYFDGTGNPKLHFNRGAIAEISLSKHPLRVITFE